MAYASWSVVFGEQPSAAKWNILGTNDSSFNDGTGIAVSAITPEKLLTGTGTSWVYTSYTPTLTNLTLGTGTMTTNYKQTGKGVAYKGRITIGNNAPSGVLTVTLPITSVTSYTSREPIGVGSVFDTSTSAYYPLYAVWISSTTFKLVAFTTLTGANPVFMDIGSSRDLSGTTPVTFATGDIISWKIEYEAA